MAWWPFGRRNSEKPPTEVIKIFEKVTRFLDDELAQNNALPKGVQHALMQNSPCDYVPHAFGEFGHTLTSPIPVNGPVGEILYLSRLETTSGKVVAFHRLGAFENVDAFELVSEDGRQWDVLYLSLYYPRKSRAIPAKYRTVSDRNRRSQIRGTNIHVPSFPANIFLAANKCAKDLIGLPIADPRLKSFEGLKGSTRPREHLEKLRQLEFTGRTSAGPHGSAQTSGSPDQSDRLFEFFNETSRYISDHIQQSSGDMGASISKNFERELTYVMLYVFTMLLFSNSSRLVSGVVDRLAETSLKYLSGAEGVALGVLVREYRARFTQYKEVNLLVPSNQESWDNGVIVLGRNLAGRDSMAIGSIAVSIIGTAMEPIRDALSELY